MINSKRAYTYMTHKFDIRKSSKGWYAFVCPYCGGGSGSEKSASVNFTTQSVKCWRLKNCAYKDTLSNFIADQEGLSWRGLREFINTFDESDISLSDVFSKSVSKSNHTNKVVLPDGYKTLLEGDGIIARKAIKYLTRRGFDIEKLDYKGFGYCDEHDKDYRKDFYGYIVIPFYNIKSNFIYYIGRDFLNRDKKYKYKNPYVDYVFIGKSDLLYNEQALNLKTAFMVEGWACAETIGKHGFATLGWSLSNVQKSKILRSNIDELVIVPDVGAYYNAIKIALDFIAHFKIKVLNFDTLSSYGNDVNSVGYDRFYNLYKNTDYLTLSNAIKILTDK